MLAKNIMYKININVQFLGVNDTMDKNKQTCKKIIKNYCRLLQYKDKDSITVSDISKASNISRTTFYHYFNSKKDLDREMIGVYLDDITSIIYQSPSLDTTITLKILNYLSDNQEVMQSLILYYPNIYKIFNHYIRDIISYSNLMNCGESQDYPEVTQKYVFELYIASIEVIIIKWISCGCKESPQQIIEVLKLLLV
ncbi:TetR/AcrR family transcriptional regulator [Streptococcus equi subsp. zooepidemicus]|nr:TetR/AcrR family transcriptional regulator [Streptococcus equi subsp. zooepidemicus]